MMKFLFKATTFIALLNMLIFTFTYICEKQWENAMCWAACAFMVLACRYYEWKAEEIEKFNQFLMAKGLEKTKNEVVDMMAKTLMNSVHGTNKTDGNGREQE